MMVYITLNVSNNEKILDFYNIKINLFSRISDRRLSCNFGPKLIIDLDNKTPSKTKFGVQFSEVTILEKLNHDGILYNLEENLSGQHLFIQDPEGNEIWITSETGEIN
jgi:hypothetical protein